MLILQDITYLHPNKDALFTSLNLVVNPHDKIALIGANGVGKSTLLKILSGQLCPLTGVVKAKSKAYVVPQLFGQFNGFTIAQALQVDDKLQALTEILAGNATLENMELLDDDWTIEERCKEAMAHWGLAALDLNQQLSTLSGGQKTRVFLTGMVIHQPELVLLDEPTNHLDDWSRNKLYAYIQSTKQTLVVVSHDRTLLNLLASVYELNKNGITVYGGNYDFYLLQKTIKQEALNQEFKSKEKTLRKAKETEREALERQQKLDSRGKKKQEKAGMPTIVMNSLRNSAERSTSKMKGVHAEKVGNLTQELSRLRSALPDKDQMKLDLVYTRLFRGKPLVTAKGINFGYEDKLLWKQPLNFQLTSGQRIAIKGLNGSGKTTLIKMILGKIEPRFGTMERTAIHALYIDQDYSLIDDQLTVYELAQKYNTGTLQEHEIKIRLSRFLFNSSCWDKPCAALSGGEKMRLMLCTLTMQQQAPELMVLDEPTNNLDLQNIEILTAAINEYQGTLVVVTHDAHFLEQINVADAIVTIRDN
ncbi:ABC-F family ATP-binding cassette domain-containing protein [Pedobacter sp. Hv1]|uniref:ABC-F family ATP-binding cassette domain-containing protein n=1 Tax=Pedobacter sp. Hv1 TaxID=1740090 RepID=UPI0006D8CD61|nr:ABC-F family ATP-binding cassette domain-containing protein [Pedobacter sp. Hv1]KQB98833.1 ABC transporter ATP-binding protein [Pedobacter sp. Hv1]